jgi:hypothetical protein
MVGVKGFALFLRYPSGYVYGDRENVCIRPTAVRVRNPFSGLRTLGICSKYAARSAVSRNCDDRYGLPDRDCGISRVR